MRKTAIIIFVCVVLATVPISYAASHFVTVEKGDYLFDITDPNDYELVVFMRIITEFGSQNQDYRPGSRPFPGDIYDTVELPEWDEPGIEYIKPCWERISDGTLFCGSVRGGTLSEDGWYIIGGAYPLYSPELVIESIID